MSGLIDNELQRINNTGHIARAQIPPEGRIPGRQVPGVQVPNVEDEPMRYIALALIHLRKHMADLAKMAANKANPVDEYNPVPPAGSSLTTITVQPQFEGDEEIESIVVNGPPGNVSLQLGDRVWAVTIPATGILVIAPVRVILNRASARILTAATPGQYNLELMGYADVRT